MAQTNSSTSLLSSFSFGTCAPTQDFPTLSCLPALWLAFFAACVFAALGFGVILVMKLRRCYQLSRGRKDVYFNEVEFLAPQVLRGGCVGAGTSSMLRGEQWVDIEQRALLYSPDPRAAAFRARERGDLVVVGGESGRERLAAPEGSEGDDRSLAVTPDWDRRLGMSKPGGVFSGSGEVCDSGVIQDRPPLNTLTEERRELSYVHPLYLARKEAEPGRRVSMP
jgi:hypothetical protein